jgi:hypothetical protein
MRRRRPILMLGKLPRGEHFLRRRSANLERGTYFVWREKQFVIHCCFFYSIIYAFMSLSWLILRKFVYPC